MTSPLTRALGRPVAVSLTRASKDLLRILMLSHWRATREGAQGAYDALDARHPGWVSTRDETGGIIHHDDTALMELHRAEADAVAAARVLPGFAPHGS